MERGWCTPTVDTTHQGLTPHERGSDDSSDSHFSILNSEKSIVKLVEIHRVLGSENLVQYWKVKITQYSNTTHAVFRR